MKDKILTIIQNNSEDLAADELTALMCYREVLQFFRTVELFDIGLDNYSIITHLAADYSEETILQAIEKYKNDHK